VHDAERQRLLFAPGQGSSEEQNQQLLALLVGLLSETFSQPAPLYLQHVQEVSFPRLDAALNAADPGEWQPAAPTQEEELAECLIEWVQTPTWADSRAFLEAHPQLLSDEAEQVLDDLSTHQEDEGARRTLEEHLALLRQSRTEGVAAAFAARIRDEQVARQAMLENVPADLKPILDELDHLVHPADMPRRIALCQRALALVERGQNPALWAALQHELASSLVETPEGERAENVEMAIEHYTLALEVYTPDAFPEEWAATQWDLASAYVARIHGKRADNLEQAIKHYTLALEIYTPQSDPERWAAIQNNLASAHVERTRGERAESLRQAIEHYSRALQVYTPQDFPVRWAFTQHNLAMVYADRGDWDRAGQFYRNALEINRQVGGIYGMAQIIGNLGDVYMDRGSVIIPLSATGRQWMPRSGGMTSMPWNRPAAAWRGWMPSGPVRGRTLSSGTRPSFRSSLYRPGLALAGMSTQRNLATPYTVPFFGESFDHEKIERYSDVKLPRYTTVQVPVTLQVRLTVRPQSPDAQQMVFWPEHPDQPFEVEVYLFYSPDDFELEGRPSRWLTVLPDGDSEPVAFRLTPLTEGDRELTVDYYHQGTWAGSVTVQTTVQAAEPAPAEQAPAEQRGGVLLFGQRAPDIVLRVQEVKGEDRTYRYLVISPDADLVPDPGPDDEWTLKLNEPEGYVQRLIGELNAWAKRGSADEVLFREEIYAMGAYLYERLFPKAMKAWYWAKVYPYLELGRTMSWLIVSSEPWIPWELVRPEEPGHPGRFLCEAFLLGRWLAPQAVPDRLDLDRLGLLVPPSRLQYGQDEVDFVKGLLGEAARDIPPYLHDVLSALRSEEYGALHVVGHGRFTPDVPERSIVPLGDSPLTPDKITGQNKTLFAARRPLVFLNACEVGRQGYALSGLGGWAPTLIEVGASVFLGSTWRVTDRLAKRFAETFYNALWTGRTVGEAVREARSAIREGTDPSWLGYVLYAHPLAQVTFVPLS
jgi:tetratricopeptide (TPR) repeat protein